MERRVTTNEIRVSPGSVAYPVCMTSRALTLLLSAFLLVACGDDDTSAPECTTAAECASGQICRDMMCVTAPTRDDTGVLDTGSMDTGLADTGSPDTNRPDTTPPLQEWILSIDNDEDFTVHRLVRISIAEADYGAVTEICADVAYPDSLPESSNTSSLTFNRGLLMASTQGELHGDTMIMINPCECTATVVGQYGFTAMAGITSDSDQDMYGLSSGEEAFVSIDPTSAMATLLMELAEPWGTLGLTWTGDDSDTLWGIDGMRGRLVEFDSLGNELSALDLGYDFGSVGVEYHPGVDTIFACSSSGELLVVDPATGNVDVGPDLGIPQCNNLAAPFGSVECIF